MLLVSSPHVQELRRQYTALSLSSRRAPGSSPEGAADLLRSLVPSDEEYAQRVVDEVASKVELDVTDQLHGIAGLAVILLQEAGEDVDYRDALTIEAYLTNEENFDGDRDHVRELLPAAGCIALADMRGILGPLMVAADR